MLRISEQALPCQHSLRGQSRLSGGYGKEKNAYLSLRGRRALTVIQETLSRPSAIFRIGVDDPDDPAAYDK
jgi:hypothetical protein